MLKDENDNSDEGTTTEKGMKHMLKHARALPKTTPLQRWETERFCMCQSDPFSDIKERIQEEAVESGRAFTFPFHRSRATAERRLPQAHFEVSPQSRQCLHSSSTLPH